MRHVLVVTACAAFLACTGTDDRRASSSTSAPGAPRTAAAPGIRPLPPPGPEALPLCRAGAAGVTCDAAAPEPAAAFVPGRLVVKFRGVLAEPADVVHGHGLRFGDHARAGATSAGDDLDRLFARHRVRSVRLAFPAVVPEGDARPGRDVGAERRRALAAAIARSQAAYPARAARAARGDEAPDLTRVFVVDLPEDADVRSAAREWSASPAVEWAAPDAIMEALGTPNDPYFLSDGAWGQSYGDLWALETIGAPAAWDVSTGEGVVVAVVDSGLDVTHPDIAANVWTNAAEAAGVPGADDDGNGVADDVHGFDFIESDPTPQDANGHGTHVAGTIAAVANNGVGVVGVAPGAKILPVRGLDQWGYGSNTSLANAIAYAARTGADVISNSWGCYGASCDSEEIREAVRLARSLGCIVTVAAGNDAGDVRLSFPANLDDVMTVASTGADDSSSSFTNHGFSVDVAAPGGGPSSGAIPSSEKNILSLRAAGTRETGPDAALVVGGDYLRLSGTSMATPHVSGVAALVLAVNPSLTAAEVEAIIRHSAADLVGDPELDAPGYDPYYGWGRLDAAAAVRLAHAPPGDPPVLHAEFAPIEMHVARGACGPWRAPIAVSNLGGGALAWTSSGPEWVGVEPQSGTGTSLVVASVTTAAERSGVITVAAAGAQGSPVEVPFAQHLVPGIAMRACDVELGRTVAGQQWAPQAHISAGRPEVPDGAGGVIAVWTDTRSNNPDLFVQRVGRNGEPLWQRGGLALTSRAPGAEVRPDIASDGAGGAMVVWEEGTNTENKAAKHIRAQRIDATGAKLWGPDGVWVCQAQGGQERPAVISDGAGGAIVAWSDSRSARGVFAQHVSADGTPAWTVDGVRVSTDADPWLNVAMAPDGSGGAYVVWTSMFEVYAQRVAAGGALLWTGNGIRLAPDRADGPNVVSDGAGGAIVAWHDFRNLPPGPDGTALDRSDLYVSRLDGAGRRSWGANGVPATEGVTASPSTFAPGYLTSRVTMAPDGEGGALLVWHDARSEVGWDVYAQRIGPDGARRWGPRGAPVTTAPGNQLEPAVAPDGRGGAYVAWSDERRGDRDVYFQRLDATGARAFPADGLWVEGTPGNQAFPFLTPMSRRGVLVTWDDLDDCLTCGWPSPDRVGKVLELNDAPVPLAQAIALEEDARAPVTLGATDAEQDGLTFEIASGPAHGTLEGSTPALVYVPDPDFFGTDAFAFTASDGSDPGGVATVTLSVAAVNDAPIALAARVQTRAGEPVPIALRATDVEGDALAYAVVEEPAHGALSGAAPDVTYVPDPGFAGTDAFRFTARDGTLTSAAATVTVAVAAGPPSSPKGGGGCTSVADAAPLAGLLLLLLPWRRRAPLRR